jgi:hypothetical protein
MYRHGKSRTVEYSTWKSIKQRCSDPSSSIYVYYGGRGITVCRRWLDSFQAFLEDVGERPSKGYVLERINMDGNYEPGNCRWSTRKEQQSHAHSVRGGGDWAFYSTPVSKRDSAWYREYERRKAVSPRVE